MDAATATLMAAKIGVVGGVGGVVIGVALERLLRYLGGVWCEPAHYEVRPESGNHYEGIKIATEPDAAAWASGMLAWCSSVRTAAYRRFPTTRRSCYAGPSPVAVPSRRCTASSTW